MNTPTLTDVPPLTSTQIADIRWRDAQRAYDKLALKMLQLRREVNELRKRVAELERGERGNT